MGRSRDEIPELEGSVTVVPGMNTAAVVPGEQLSALVLSQTLIASYELSDLGELTIGRSSSAEIHLDDRLVSRRHAVLAAGPRATIRDLGSSNGTYVGGVRLSPGMPRELAIGDVVLVGSAALLIQRGAATVQPRRFWSQAKFKERLDEACAGGAACSIACLEVSRHAPEVGVRQVLAARLRGSDVVGEAGPSSYALLLAHIGAEQAEVVLQRIAGDLTSHNVDARWGIAEFPAHGRTADELLARARPGAVAPRPALAEATGGRVIADPVTQQVFAFAERIAVGDISVLIIGETGVGKEVMAEEIHGRSPRAARPFVRLNCAALSESLLESELFGHERGAFTSAVGTKPGLLETADGGTVLLDEIGEMPMSLQAKLLRVIEERQVRRVGGVKAKPLDVRFIAATNRNLEKQITEGLFRRDLYYRLAAATIEIPSLRHRKADIEPLARHFLQQASRHLGVAASLSPEAIASLRAYRWPGNIRELRNAIERAVLLAGATPITAAHLPVEKSGEPDEPVADDDDEAQRISAVLAECGGNQSRAAKRLGMSRGALIRRLERYQIVRPRKPD